MPAAVLAHTTRPGIKKLGHLARMRPVQPATKMDDSRTEAAKTHKHNQGGESQEELRKLALGQRILTSCRSSQQQQQIN